MEPDQPAAVPDRDDAAVRTTTDSFGCLDVQHQAGPGRGDRADMDTFDTKKRVCPLAPSTVRAGSSIGHIRFFFIWKLGRYQFKEALTSLLPHHAAAASRHAPTLGVRGPNHAHLRRAGLAICASASVNAGHCSRAVFSAPLLRGAASVWLAE
jgi:hypothetical protein